MKKIDKAMEQVANAIGVATATASIIKDRGAPVWEEQERILKSVAERLDSVRGNRPKDAELSWEDLELALIGGLKMALEILEA